MDQFSVEIMRLPGSLLGGNQQKGQTLGAKRTNLGGQDKSEDAIHRRLVAEHGLDADFTLWSDRRFAAYLARIEEVRPFDLAREIWQRAASLGLEQAIVSNAPRGILDANMTRMGLASGAVVVTVSRNEVTRGKPHPDPDLCALARLSLPASRAVVVEDSGSGLAAARAAGLPVLLMGPAPGDWTPVAELHRLLSHAPQG